MFYQIFFSPYVKQSGIISNKHGTYELPDKLPNNLRLRKSVNISKISKMLQNYNLVPILLVKMKTL